MVQYQNKNNSSKLNNEWDYRNLILETKKVNGGNIMKRFIAIIMATLLTVFSATSIIVFNQKGTSDTSGRRISVCNIEKALPPEQILMDAKLPVDKKGKKKNNGKNRNHYSSVAYMPNNYNANTRAGRRTFSKK